MIMVLRGSVCADASQERWTGSGKSVWRADHRLIDLSQLAQERSRNIIHSPEVHDHAVFLLDFAPIFVYLAAIAQDIMTMTGVTTLLEAAIHM